ncbi:hypothetical protein GCM10023191_026170 [Actinoallomurus oryzae]|uniref:Uncharacterized protein n=1 Tax=Actinoallomurus oryzae TaxID=502180 RepID=A0ABP8PR39_9ACTN
MPECYLTVHIYLLLLERLMEAVRMNRLMRAVTMLVVVTGISLGAGSTPATAAVISAGHSGPPGVFHCC